MSAHSGRSRRDKLRQERQEALREQLAAQGHLQHVTDLLEETLNLEPSDTSDFILKRNMQVVDKKLSLIKKYCPDLSNLQVQADVENRTTLVDLSGGKLEKALGDNEPGDSSI